MGCHRCKDLQSISVQRLASRRDLRLNRRRSWYERIPYALQCSGFNEIYSSAGQDATEIFYGLHRHEILERPQYQRLQIGVIKGQQPVIHSRVVGEISHVPYAEPTWLSPGYHSPYYTEVSCHDHLFGV